MKLIITLFIVMLLLTACAKQDAQQGTKKDAAIDTSSNIPKISISNFGIDDVFADEGELTPPSFGE